MDINDALAFSKKNAPKSVALPHHDTQPIIRQAPDINPNPQPNTDSPVETTTQTKASFESVSINIAGMTHRINCPSDDVANLEASADHLNQKIRDLRQAIKSKSPSNEELLVLICLELHDKLKSLEKQHSSNTDEKEQERLLLDKILQEARSIL